MALWVGIAGPLGSGKSYLANALAKEFRKVRKIHTEVVPFALWLKMVASVYETMAVEPATHKVYEMYKSFGATSAQAIEIAHAIAAKVSQFPFEPGVKNRVVLQYIGHEMGRMFLGEDVWVRQATEYVSLSNARIILTDDMRYPNEAAAVDYRIRINAPPAEDSHPSEHSLTGYPTDLVIEPLFGDDVVRHVANKIVVQLLAKEYFQED